MRPSIIKIIFAISLALIGLNSVWLLIQQPNIQARSISDNQIATANPLAIKAGIEINVDEIVADGLTCPVQVTHAGDGSDRLFVVEQVGTIKIISDSSVLPTPYLDVSALISGPGSCTGNERGLLGLAFHPDYTANGEFYINYTDTSGDTVIARYTVSTDTNVANAASAETVLAVNQTAPNHNGGQLLFGLDGYLYIGMGDGGGSNDPNSDAQDTTSLLGKMLRINVTDVDTYTIPATNPFTNTVGVRDEIWAIGLRNPWRFSVDRLTGDLIIGDVGQTAWEEIDVQPVDEGGLNFGWPCREGLVAGTVINRMPCNDNSFVGPVTDPIVVYPRSEGRSVTGGFIYRGSQYPNLTGHYFYGDYVRGKIWSIEKTGATAWGTPQLLDPISGFGFAISAFGEDEAGELYVVEYNFADGKVRRLKGVSPTMPDLSTSTKTASTTNATLGETVTYTLRLEDANGPISQTIILSDTLPTGLNYLPNSLQASQGITDDSAAPLLRWQGTLSPTTSVTITYAVTTTGEITGTLINQAYLNDGVNTPFTLTASLIVGQSTSTYTLYLPSIVKN